MKIDRRQFKRRLHAVWEHASPLYDMITPSPFRYIPRAFEAGHTGWGVFDRKADKFLHDHEVAALSVEVLRDEKLPELLQ